jgi:ligand-binding SRPBCC domain-containing protein
MADHVIERRFWLPRPRPEVFEFFADPRNLPLVNPPAARLAWRSPPPAALAAGTVLDFSVRVWGVAIPWRVMIREFDPPYRFVDVQLRGPFARWEHRHRFAAGPEIEGGLRREAEPGGESGPEGTWVEDRVTYRPSLGPLGRAAHALGAGRQIAGLFDYRERRLRELLGRR